MVVICVCVCLVVGEKTDGYRDRKREKVDRTAAACSEQGSFVAIQLVV